MHMRRKKVKERGVPVVGNKVPEAGILRRGRTA